MDLETREPQSCPQLRTEINNPMSHWGVGMMSSTLPSKSTNVILLLKTTEQSHTKQLSV